MHMIEMYFPNILLQVFLKFKTPFWAKKENNLAEPILYGKLPVEKKYTSSSWTIKNNDLEEKPKMGATGKTDGHLKQVNFILFYK